MNGPPAKGCEHGHAGTKQRRGRRSLESYWESKYEPLVRSDALGKPPHVPDARRLLSSAQILSPCATLLALVASGPLPTHADALTHGEMAPRAESSDRPDDLVTWNERVSTGRPVIVDQMEIAVANPTVRDLDLHLTRLERPRFVGVGPKRLFGRRGGECANSHGFTGLTDE
jgi:hypothetical protein